MHDAASSFDSLYASGVAQLLTERLVADMETAVSASMKLARLGGPTFLLESVEGGAVRGRYSMIGLIPDLIWRARDGKATINRQALHQSDAFEALCDPPLESLRALIRESAIPVRDDLAEALPTMAAGLFGYLGYDMVREMERLPKAKPDTIGTPDSIFIRPTIMVIFDSVRDEMMIVTPVRVKAGVTAKMAREAAQERIDAVINCLETPLPRMAESASVETTSMSHGHSNTSQARYLEMVEAAKEYIRAGDIFQVVLSQRFSSPFTLGGFALYRALRRVNPSPYLCYLHFGDFEIVCSSPEILVKLRDGKVTIRPIAGTRPRGDNRMEDIRLGEELLADEKERAEHLMLLDLGRNDVGRVSEIGSVTVTDSFFLERYSHVMHIVSNVEGTIRNGLDALDALTAGFPAGTVSGAPKVRAMEIIDALETDRRGIYAGCIGYFGADGSMDTCIVLRTAIVKDGMMHVTAGAGIVYDSSPIAEYDECINKSKALFRAAEEAGRFAAKVKRGQ
ncbi:MAG: anthranilate synthase component I [Beijerinckiaceae bacterium]